MKNTFIFAGLISFSISAVLAPLIIPLLTRIKVGQTEREDGPKSHLSKTGTPTMGAFIFLIAFLAVSLFFAGRYDDVMSIILLTVGYAIAGFLDDYIKVVLKRSEGLTPAQKMACQLIVSGAYACWCFFKQGKMFSMLIPFAGEGKIVTMGWIGIPIFMFIILGTVNGSNFTDGVDGLESSVTAAICVFLFAVSLRSHEGVAIVNVIMFAALLGFLTVNVHKAKVFMGDTGSLALGGFVVASAHIMGLELYLPIICLIYFVEVLSVILQVGYFKLTHGKRIFRMAPIHHHFELGGWSETKVVGIFTIVTIVLCALCLLFVKI